MKRTILYAVFALSMLVALVCVPVGLSAGEEANPLAPFERLIGHEWHLEGSVQVLDWGAGKQSVVARSYFEVDGERRLVSEGLWYWHPGDEQIRGVFTAIMMPVSLFEYTTRFEGDTMINDLVTFTPEGKREEHRETWVIADDSYEWTLFAKTDDGEKKSMGGTFVRKAAE